MQPGSSHTGPCSLVPRNTLFTKVFWHTFIIKSSKVDMRHVRDCTDVQDTKILQYLHVFETSALKERTLIAFFSGTDVVLLLERSPQSKY